ncbi:MAG: response regulator [Campylobacterales bacterium]|nr:response regulator [Campylobacterales bacterium]
MDKLKLLIADDSEDNRLVLRAICRKLEGFEIRDAVDGLEAIEITQTWQPHIILMDIMMPKMDGFEASKIIKEQYPDVVIIAVTAVIDSRVEDNMSLIGVDIYIHKPVDRELIRYKLQSIAASLRVTLGKKNILSTKIALNPFNSDIRSFKTIFDILNAESMMDFGMWLFDQYNGKSIVASNKFDRAVEVFYMLMSQGNKNGETMSIIIEESYEEFYITMKFDRVITLEQKVSEMLKEFGTEFILQENIVCVRLSKPQEIKVIAKEIPKYIEKILLTTTKVESTCQSIQEEIQESVKEVKEIRVIQSNERELLHQSFVNKTSAADYVSELGGDVLEEILDLTSIDEEWEGTLGAIEKNPTEENFVYFADSVLNVYVRAINNLFEFTALAYALTSLSVFMKESAKVVSEDSEKIKMLIMLLEHLGKDLTSWREHIFILQDTADIHYVDSSFFSSCMQIEAIIDDKHVDADDENDMEFF